MPAPCFRAGAVATITILVRCERMSLAETVVTHVCGRAHVRIYPSREALGAAAARQAAGLIQDAIAQAGRARIVVATGNSQLDLIGALVRRQGIDWNRVDIFHMDEYVGISRDHPASFRKWVRTRVEEKVSPGSTEYLEGDVPDLDAEMARYARLLSAGPIDLAFVGIGENGHIAFNDPAVADFEDPLMVKRVVLDLDCRHQQVGEGHFENIDAVPREALTLTCPALFRARSWICSVPETRKAAAVRNALEGPVSTACPGSLVRTHPHAAVYLDSDSAALLAFPASKAR
jgi:glucosamine-6-phosphate deaminase